MMKKSEKVYDKEQSTVTARRPVPSARKAIAGPGLKWVMVVPKGSPVPPLQRYYDTKIEHGVWFQAPPRMLRWLLGHSTTYSITVLPGDMDPKDIPVRR